MCLAAFLEGACLELVRPAARLEPAGKHYGTSILVSEDTWAAAREAFDFREIDRIRVVGRNEAVGIYELLARKGSVDGNDKALYDPEHPRVRYTGERPVHCP